MVQATAHSYEDTCNTNPADNPYGVANPVPAVFNFNLTHTLADISDGTSNTMMVSETIAAPPIRKTRRGIWWYEWGARFSAQYRPNSPIPDQVWSTQCVSTTESPCTSSAPCWTSEVYSARSLHINGVNVLLADGSVHFVSNKINLHTWQYLAGINDGEVVTGAFD